MPALTASAVALPAASAACRLQHPAARQALHRPRLAGAALQPGAAGRRLAAAVPQQRRRAALAPVSASKGESSSSLESAILGLGEKASFQVMRQAVKQLRGCGDLPSEG